MSKKSRENKMRMMLPIIESDLEKMCDIANANMTLGGKAAHSRDYLNRQIEKYLKPLDIHEWKEETRRIITVVQSPPLLNMPDNEGAVIYKKPNWDTEGDGPEHVDWRLRTGGGWAQLGKHGGLKIRINQKAFWLFPELTLRGVIVHEATHYGLDTRDTLYSSFNQNETLQNLANGSINADNWRIFYQKMSRHLAAL